jgi:tight adherence protein B
MEKDGAALLLLLFVLVLAMIGTALLVSGSARRAALAERGRGGEDEPVGTRARQAVDARLRRSRHGRRLATWLQAAGSPVAPADFLLLCTAAALVLAVLGAQLMPRGIALVLAVAATAAAARAWVERRRAMRRDEFIAQLPDLARVLANGTSAGLSMAGAVALAARELPEPAAAEMRTVVQELRLGVPLEESLERLRDRLPSREVAVLMTTLIIQQRAGGDTVRALSELGGTLEARKDLLREIRTMLSGAVFTSYLVAAMGAGTIVLINALSPGIMRELTTTLPGIVALVLAGTLYAIAFALIRRITRVET